MFYEEDYSLMLKKNVIEYFDTVRNVAAVLNITEAAVSQWGPIIPEKRALQLERLTGGNLVVEKKNYKANRL